MSFNHAAKRVRGVHLGGCDIADRAPLSSEAQFWSDLIADHLVRLADADGKSISPEQLPGGLAQMPDDPYRSLAWRLRKNGGFCRSIMPQKEFAEFTSMPCAPPPKRCSRQRSHSHVARLRRMSPVMSATNHPISNAGTTIELPKDKDPVVFVPPRRALTAVAI
ncbi:ParB/Srx family N-terminal domain-containing protein [Bradyrhizobium sp. USDA 3686]